MAQKRMFLVVAAMAVAMPCCLAYAAPQENREIVSSGSIVYEEEGGSVSIYGGDVAFLERKLSSIPDVLYEPSAFCRTDNTLGTVLFSQQCEWGNGDRQDEETMDDVGESDVQEAEGFKETENKESGTYESGEDRAESDASEVGEDTEDSGVSEIDEDRVESDVFGKIEGTEETDTSETSEEREEQDVFGEIEGAKETDASESNKERGESDASGEIDGDEKSHLSEEDEAETSGEKKDAGQSGKLRQTEKVKNGGSL